MVPFDMDRLYEPKHREVMQINPKRQVPVLIHGDLEIDSTQIFEYLEDLKPSPALWPAGPIERARARLLELKSDEVFFPPIIRLMGLQDRLDDPAAVEARTADMNYYREMERLLADRDFLAGPYSFADIALMRTLRLISRPLSPTPKQIDRETHVAGMYPQRWADGRDR